MSQFSQFLDGSNIGDDFECRPLKSCQVGRVCRLFFSPASPQHILDWVGPGRAGTVGQLSLTIHLDKEVSYLDTALHKISIPRLGLKGGVNTKGGLILENIPTVGTIVGEPSSNNTCPLFRQVTRAPKIQHFEDKSSGKDKGPDLLIVKQHGALEDDKSVALQLLQEISTCNRKCWTSQYRQILICWVNRNEDQGAALDKEVLSQLPSGAWSFFEINLDRSLSRLLYSICLERRKDLQNTLNNFPALGWKILGTRRGVISLEIGERGILLACESITGTIIKETRGTCCSNFPLNVTTSGSKSQVVFLSPVTRMVSDQCQEQVCSHDNPPTLNLDPHRSICSFKEGIMDCPPPLKSSSQERICKR